MITQTIVFVGITKNDLAIAHKMLLFISCNHSFLKEHRMTSYNITVSTAPTRKRGVVGPGVRGLGYFKGPLK